MMNTTAWQTDKGAAMLLTAAIETVPAMPVSAGFSAHARYYAIQSWIWASGCSDTTKRRAGMIAHYWMRSVKS